MESTYLVRELFRLAVRLIGHRALAINVRLSDVCYLRVVVCGDHS
jgi:hypothetical protein